MSYTYIAKRHVDLGIDYMNSDETRAIQEFETAIDFDPVCLDAYYWRGKVYYNIGDYELALKDFSYAIHSAPKEKYEYYEARGDVNIKRNDYNYAIDDYTVAIDIHPSRDLYIKRGIAYELIKYFDSAEADFRKAETGR